MNMKKIVNDYIDDLESKAKSSDKYFMERNKLYIEKEELQDKVFELENRVDFLIDRNDKKQEVLDKIKEYAKANKIIEIISLLEVEEIK